MKSNKLSKSEFARALKLGHGRVLLHLREHGDAGVEDEIVEALVNDYCFDRQLEGGRELWLCQILNNTNRSSFYAEKCYDLYLQNKVICNQVQQIELCEYFFELGFEKFRPMMLQKFRSRYVEVQEGPYFDTEILNTCGLFGLSYLINTVLAFPEQLDEFYSGMLMRTAIEEFYADDLNPCIEEIRSKTPNAQAFFDICEKFEEDDKAERVSVENCPRITLEEILSLLNARKHSYGGNEFKRFGRQATVDELDVIVDKLLHAENAYQLIYLFRVFDSRALPSVHETLLSHVESENEKVALSAVGAFANNADPAIRNRALSMLGSDNPAYVYRALALLENNYETNDAGLIADRLRVLSDEFHIHSSGMALLRIAKAFEDRGLTPAIFWMYENNPDTWCRTDFLKLLQKWNVLPVEILSESQWDAGSEVRYFSRSVIAEQEMA